jgi:hypothetical protein
MRAILIAAALAVWSSFGLCAWCAVGNGRFWRRLCWLLGAWVSCPTALLLTVAALAVSAPAWADGCYPAAPNPGYDDGSHGPDWPCGHNDQWSGNNFCCPPGYYHMHAWQKLGDWTGEGGKYGFRESPAWGQSYTTTICPDDRNVSIIGKPSADPCNPAWSSGGQTWLGVAPQEDAAPATTPDELKAAAESIDSTVRHTLVETLGAIDKCPAKPGASDTTPFCIVAVGEGALPNATTMSNTIAVGRCVGTSLTTESYDILIGDNTTAPLHRDGFVNIGNRLCFWRDTGERAACPAPEPECTKP